MKSSTDRAEVRDYISRWQSHDHEEFYMVYHTTSENFDDLQDNARGLYLMGPNELAERVVLAGLMQWLIDKRS